MKLGLSRVCYFAAINSRGEIMFKRLKKALVESFVGAIALGWLLAQGIIHFAYIFIGLLTTWIANHPYFGLVSSSTTFKDIFLQQALIEAGRAFGLLLLGYMLLRWLYFTPVGEQEKAV